MKGCNIHKVSLDVDAAMQKTSLMQHKRDGLMTEKKEDKTSDLPSFDPQGTESLKEIPARFLLGGLLRLSAEGRWSFQGEWIEHTGVCQFLQRQMRRTAEGTYWVINGPQRVTVEIEDAPYLIREVYEQDDVLWGRLSDGSREILRLECLYASEDAVLYAEVKVGEAGASEGEGHRARFSREAIGQISAWLEEDSGGRLGVGYRERFYPLLREKRSG